MTLPYDTARCARTRLRDENCPLKSSCLRHLSPGHPTYQTYSDFPGGMDCDGYIPVRIEK